MPSSDRHLALVGATASGKSAVALEVARRLGDVELVSVDAMQVYRGMDIGTAKPTAEERAAVPYHLLDVADPAEEFTVVRFQHEFRSALAAIEERGHRALLVGGTALYLRVAVDELEVPGRYPHVHAELEADPDTARLHRRLAELDPVGAARMTPDNRRRVVRALEVTVGSGRPFSSFGPGLSAHPPTRFRLAGLWLTRAAVNARIAARFHQMLAAGLVAEVRQLVAGTGGLSRTARQALGYREVLAHLEDGGDLEDATERAISRTRAFSRRQRMWFRRDPRILWFGAARNPLDVVPALLGDWGR